MASNVVPPVQVEQSYCTREQQAYCDVYSNKSCCCESSHTLTGSVSKMTLYDENISFASRGFSSIIIPSKGYPPKNTNKSSLPPITSKTLEKSFNYKNRLKGAPTPEEKLNPVSTKQRKSSDLQPKNKTHGSFEITKRLSNIFISRRKVEYKQFSMKKEVNSSKIESKKVIENSRSLDIDVTIKDEVLNDNTSPSKPTELLHPGWRRVPWKPHFGWTDAHQQLCKLLRKEITDGKVHNIYYNTEEEHASAKALLSGPSVSTVSDVLEVIRKTAETRSPWFYKVTSRSRSSLQTSPYDADGEDSV
ncbi:uncharacterized protein LOC129004879 [Macrosteles quadrilineatus]|uniref:uncharacterized protein LOC129004879 n=1 Tax=Macrosteles quadrilineatus TaxID=74068 RepID=UPI0023E2B130|nr:uncharacterized protein LOC129004879 [Macrosteles quadrilineatus]